MPARRRGRINIFGYLLWIAVLAMTLLRARDAAAPEKSTHPEKSTP